MPCETNEERSVVPIVIIGICFEDVCDGLADLVVVGVGDDLQGFRVWRLMYVVDEKKVRTCEYVWYKMMIPWGCRGPPRSHRAFLAPWRNRDRRHRQPKRGATSYPAS